MASETITMETLDYRLGQLEKSVNELKTLLVSNKLQDKDINLLQDKVDKLEVKVDKLEKAPAENKASWFDKTTDMIFKLAITAIIGLVLLKVGLA